MRSLTCLLSEVGLPGMKFFFLLWCLDLCLVQSNTRSIWIKCIIFLALLTVYVTDQLRFSCRSDEQLSQRRKSYYKANKKKGL